MKTAALVIFGWLLTINATAQVKFKMLKYLPGTNHTVLTKEDADAAFAKIKSSSVFEFRYTRGGCDYRAHAAYLMLKKMGIKTFKIWNFPPSKIWNYSSSLVLPDVDFNKHNLLLAVKDRINLSTTGSYYSTCNANIQDVVYWGYHVAPILLVQNQNKIDSLVVDPALCDKLIFYKDWLKLQLQANATSYYTFLDGSYITFETTNTNTLTGLFYDDTFSIQNRLIEQSLSKGKVFVEYYTKEIEPLEKEMQKYSPGSQGAQRLACDIALKKQRIAVESDNNQSSVLKLPVDYQKVYQQYVEVATKQIVNN